jgi:glucokinase
MRLKCQSDLNPVCHMDNLLLALDYGGTKHAAAVLPVGGRAWAAQARAFSPAGADAAYDQATMLRMARELLSQAPGHIKAIGVSFGGPVDARAGVVRLSHHVPGWEDIPLTEVLARELGARVVMDNDANAAALGEWRYGSGKDTASLLYVTVSTGVGGGWVLGGQIWGGADGMAGEIGHIVVRPGGMPCACGKRGCVEAEACGPAMARKALARLKQDPQGGRVLLELAGGRMEAITGEMVSRAAEAGDAVALHVLTDAAAALGSGIASAINLINPEKVVVGGGVTKAGDRWWKRMRETARAEVLPQARVDIVGAGKGDDAPLWGAAALAQGLLG